MGKIANRQSLAILDRGLKSQPFSQFCCIGMFKTNRQSRVSNRSFKSQGRQRIESRVFKSLAILDWIARFRPSKGPKRRGIFCPYFFWGIFHVGHFDGACRGQMELLTPARVGSPPIVSLTASTPIPCDPHNIGNEN